MGREQCPVVGGLCDLCGHHSPCPKVELKSRAYKAWGVAHIGLATVGPLCGTYWY